ncbi:MAG: hypothetical protein E7308_07070 [Butyrivibrio sp.]|nr:hypothetical protein [Butyrivibrio sp.]
MHRYFDCIDGNMDVLLYDNTTKKVRDLKSGDLVYSVRYDGEDLKYTKGTVLEINKKRSKAVKILLTDGRALICSPEHQWLTLSGWQFSNDKGSIRENVIFLEEGRKMFGFSKSIDDRYRETRQYMAGYLISMEVYARNLSSLKRGEYADYVLENAAVANRVYQYLTYFDVNATISDTFAHDKYTNEYFKTKKVSVPYKDLLKFSEKFKKHKDEPEFVRGFVAAVYDSDTTVDPNLKTITSPKKAYLELLSRGMEQYEFEYSYNSERMEVSLIGGATELIRFYTIFNPVAKGNVENLSIRNRRLDNISVESISEVKSDDLYEVTTTTRNFIVNGIASHDCIAGPIEMENL